MMKQLRGDHGARPRESTPNGERGVFRPPPEDRPAMLDLLIVRDPKEAAHKCTLTPLRGTPGVRFVAYRPGARIDAGARLLLHPDGDELGPDDHGAPLLLVDSSWRKLPTVLAMIDGDLTPRRLPALRTAYPRAKPAIDPGDGLASIEALYAALRLTGHDRPDLLAAYRWRDEYLSLNAEALR
jgi:pre-rRNA-processing protein TSR3